jgi:hypothetical protein
MPAQAKVLRDRIIRGEEPLSLTGGLEPLYAPLALPSRLVRVLRLVVARAMLAMLYLPFVTGVGAATTKLMGILSAELPTPPADGVIGHDNSAFKQ